MEIISACLLLSVLSICAASVKCFKIKYADAKKFQRLNDKITSLEQKLENIDATAVKELQADMKTLRTHYGLTKRT